MEVILLERVEKLGQMGDVVKVKDGYARNFLLPRKKALRANANNLAKFESQKVDLEARNLTARTEAEGVAAKMDGIYCTLLRQASEGGQLFGSVTARDIAESATEGGFAVNKNQVVLGHPIKTLGVHEVKVNLHPEISVTVMVNAARSDAEAEQQQAASERGEDVTAEGAAAATEEVHVEEFFEEEALAEAEAEIEEASAEEQAEEEVAAENETEAEEAPEVSAESEDQPAEEKPEEA